MMKRKTLINACCPLLRKNGESFLAFKMLLVIVILSMLNTSGSIYARNQNLALPVHGKTLKDVFKDIENVSNYRFLYNDDFVALNKTLTVNVNIPDNFADIKVDEILTELLGNTNLTFTKLENGIVVIMPRTTPQEKTISGIVKFSDGTPVPGASVVIKGKNIGVSTNLDGTFKLTNVSPESIIVISFVGTHSREIVVGEQSYFDIVLENAMIELDEAIVIGYGTQRKGDLTGSVVRADLESFSSSSNVSILQSLKGTVPGLSVGQTDQSGQEPELLIRGKSSISGEVAPLIVVDGVIFRGNLIDINPHDIESVDILKDASAAAIYGSQATNGVIMITTKSSGGLDGKPLISYSSSYSIQTPVKELRPGSTADYEYKNEVSDIFLSRTAESGYLEKNPTWFVISTFATSEEQDAYNDGRSTDWYSVLVNDNINTQNHNLSISNSKDSNNHLISIGYTGEKGYMLKEDYSRINGRINFDNKITEWLQVGVRSSFTLSDYSGQEASTGDRYLEPYATAYDNEGEIIYIVAGSFVNPLVKLEADNIDKRLNLVGNLFANIDLPFIDGLSYRVDLGNNYTTSSLYYFREYGFNWEGEGSKAEAHTSSLTLDNVLTFNRVFNDIHKINATLVYGFEKRDYNSVVATAYKFSSKELGFNALQIGASELQKVSSSAWQEASLYSMARLFYGYKSKYLITGTLRRDGFSGFGEDNKFGLFPSLSVAWTLTEESFLKNNNWLNYLKIRSSYGSVGNRTVGRYQTLARITGGYNYVTASQNPVYTQSITSLASPNLKWETTTGINFGIDFRLIDILSGSIDYYSNNTTNLLYEVDLPGMSRFEKFPDNLGRLHNHGLELSLTSINMQKSDFKWTSAFNFSMNRNELKELLGFDLDNDGKEDDLVSEGLFIGEPINTIYDYSINGIWQVNDEIPSGSSLGTYRIVDANGDEVIDATDKTILGYADPSYRFSISNSIMYKNWVLFFFINSVQGGKKYYMAQDDMINFEISNSLMHFRYIFPEGLDYWTPENPDAIYQRINSSISTGLRGSRYIQRNFIRLQDVSLTYTFPKKILSKVNIQKLSLFLSGKNLITLTKWPGWDPETGVSISRNGRPVLKSYTIGVNVEF